MSESPTTSSAASSGGSSASTGSADSAGGSVAGASGLGFVRYLAPNMVTAGSIVCAVMAIQAALRGDLITACWWVLYSTITDKFDGQVARALNASSALGVQMDSLADLLNYGFVPAALMYAWFTAHPALGWASGGSLVLLRVMCTLYALSAAFRLARFNVSKGNPDFFFGTPTTFCGGVVAAALLACMKFGDPAWSQGAVFAGPRMLGDLRIDAWVPLLPWTLLFFAWSMMSSWRVPKGGRIKTRIVNIYIGGSVVLGWGFAIVRWLPEFVVFAGVQFLLWAVYAHFFQTPKEKPE